MLRACPGKSEATAWPGRLCGIILGSVASPQELTCAPPQVIPSEVGQNLPFYFPFTPS